jgi:hypothetical protein
VASGGTPESREPCSLRIGRLDAILSEARSGIFGLKGLLSEFLAVFMRIGEE